MTIVKIIITVMAVGGSLYWIEWFFSSRPKHPLHRHPFR